MKQEQTKNNDPLTAPTSNWRGRGHRKANLLPASQTFNLFWLC